MATNGSRVMVALARWYLSLAPVETPEYWLRRKPLKRAQMEYDDECGREGFHTWFANFDLHGKTVLDLGCGFGGHTVWYAESGAASVAGVEIGAELVEEGRAFAEKHGVTVDFRIGTAEELPFSDASFDVICSADVFEHVINVERAFRECARVLKPKGVLYAIFPSFYNPLGGSHLHGYISRSPGPNLFFPCSVLQRAVTQIMEKRGETHVLDAMRLLPSDRLWNINGMTIARFRQLVPTLPFRRKSVTLLPYVHPRKPRWKELKMEYWAFPFTIAARVPVLNEICTDRIICEFVR